MVEISTIILVVLLHNLGELLLLKLFLERKITFLYQKNESEITEGW